jgi:hypothetical protein
MRPRSSIPRTIRTSTPITSEKLIFLASNSGRARPDIATQARFARWFMASQAAGLDA